MDAVDAVYIGVPNHLHASLARTALEAGKHTLLDKPFALSGAEAREVIAVAEASGLSFMLGMNQRFSREVQTARALVADGALGDVYHVKAYWRRRAGIPRIGSWFNPPLAGRRGESARHRRAHCSTRPSSCWTTSTPVSVAGAICGKFGVRGLGELDWGESEVEDDVCDVEDFATALIRLGGGATLALDAAWAMHQAVPAAMNIELFGTEGGYSVYDAKLYREGEDGYVTVDGPAAGDLAYPHRSRMQHFVDVVAGRVAPAVSNAEALAVQDILDAIYASAAGGGEVQP